MSVGTATEAPSAPSAGPQPPRGQRDLAVAKTSKAVVMVRRIIAVVVVAALVVVGVVAVRAADGDYSGAYALTGYFSRAGEGLLPNSQVSYRGVQVGRVASISLVDRRAKIRLLIDPGFKVPKAALAVVNPQNVFGAEQVSLRFPPSSKGPYLKPGGYIAHTQVSDQFSDLFAAAAPLLNQVNAQNLGSVISELARGTAGEGPHIAQGIESGTRLAGLLDATIAAQIQALDSFTSLSAQFAPLGPTLDGLAAQTNVALPAFNQAAAKYQAALESVTPFANELATLLSDYRPSIDTLLADGDNVIRVLLAEQPGIAELITGLYQYVYKFANGLSKEALPNGSHFAFFKTFVMFSDINNLVCNLIAPAKPGLAFLEPLQQALTGAGSPFNCSSQIAAFDAAQAAPSPSSTPSSPTEVATSPVNVPPVAKALSPITSAAKKLLDQIDQALGAPSNPKAGSISSYMGMLLGGGS
ncbi:MAG: MCE family protein [Actinobacteria bacterium]|nr:MCE family protein [Actinomycetota bacterium]